MRLFADEVKNKTDQLLFTSPLAVWQIVIGKYLAASLLFLGAVGVTMLFPLMISQYGTLPVSLIVGSYVGYIFMGLGFIAIGLFISVMTENQIIAAVGTAGAIFFVFILDVIYASFLSAVTSPLPVQSNAIGHLNTRNIENRVIQQVTFAQTCIPKKLSCLFWSLQPIVYISVPLCDRNTSCFSSWVL
jgi:ABC-2 type transport system permease protein